MAEMRMATHNLIDEQTLLHETTAQQTLCDDLDGPGLPSLQQDQHL
jgi:hypothetical protein